MGPQHLGGYAGLIGTTRIIRFACARIRVESKKCCRDGQGEEQVSAQENPAWQVEIQKFIHPLRDESVPDIAFA